MVRPRHGATAGGRSAKPGERREPARPGGAVPYGAAPPAPGVVLSQDLGRLRSPLRFCAIPLIKGDYEPTPAAEVLRGARGAGGRLRELVLVGQDTSRWAQPDWGGVRAPARRARGARAARTGCASCTCSRTASTSVCCRPWRRTRPLRGRAPAACRGAVLRRMRARRRRRTPEAAARVRRAMPAQRCAATFIAGFPGETDDEFDELTALRARARPCRGRRVPLRRPGGHRRGAPARPGAGGARPRAHRPPRARSSMRSPPASGGPRRAAASRSSSSAARGPGGAALGAPRACRRRTWTAAPCYEAAPCRGDLVRP